MGLKKIRQIRLLAIYSALSFGLIINLAPLAWMISTSLKQPSEIFTFPPDWIPDHISMDNYIGVFEAVPFEMYYVNSIVVSICVTLITVLMCSMAGFAFAKLRFPFRNILFILFLTTLMVPFHVIMIPLFKLTAQLDWLDSYQGLIIPQITTGFGIFLMRQFMLSTPDSLLEAARIDGAGLFYTFVKIVLPIHRGALATLAIFSFNFSWNNLLWPLLVTNSETMRTLPVGMALFRSIRTIDWALIMAASVMALVPMIVFFLLMQKHFIRGLTAGAVKE